MYLSQRQVDKPVFRAWLRALNSRRAQDATAEEEGEYEDEDDGYMGV